MFLIVIKWKVTSEITQCYIGRTTWTKAIEMVSVQAHCALLKR